MDKHLQLLEANRAWAKRMVEEDPEFFTRSLHVQRPEYLWIGCSDSRVPPELITQMKPGMIFNHRNIANQVIHTDMNLLSVLQYAVEVLGVNHVIVCGHYGCGGVKAAMTRHDYGLINKWLRHIKDVYRLHEAELEAIADEQMRLNRLIELNVIEQVQHVADTSIVQRAWKRRRAPHLHGWVYNLADGIITPLIDIPAGSHLDHPIYEFEDLQV
ncbi:MAG: carbonic anhydrase [Saprospiraceae bacterium]|nr:carbonic anhydrase [Saprospiraceae bacterium]MDW8483011.1 carbonic anhydrase [Saprospiraceae bacterium]